VYVCGEVGDAGGDAGVELGWELLGCDENTWIHGCWMLSYRGADGEMAA
jgi:hypothetical protein